MDLADVRWARWGGCCLVDKLKKPPAVVSVVRWLYAFQTANRNLSAAPGDLFASSGYLSSCENQLAASALGVWWDSR